MCSSGARALDSVAGAPKGERKKNTGRTHIGPVFVVPDDKDRPERAPEAVEVGPRHLVDGFRCDSSVVLAPIELHAQDGEEDLHDREEDEGADGGLDGCHPQLLEEAPHAVVHAPDAQDAEHARDLDGLGALARVARVLDDDVDEGDDDEGDVEEVPHVPDVGAAAVGRRAQQHLERKDPKEDIVGDNESARNGG